MNHANLQHLLIVADDDATWTETKAEIEAEMEITEIPEDCEDLDLTGLFDFDE